MIAFHPPLLRCFSRKGRLLPMATLSVRVSRKDGVGISGATARKCLIAILHPSSLALGPPSTTYTMAARRSLG
jgi:hypothetical protein